MNHGNSSSAADPLALSREHPELSACTPLVRSQKVALAAGGLALLALSLWRPWPTARAFVLLSTVYYLVFTIYKLLLVRFSVSRNAEIAIDAGETKGLREKDLPVFSILVPMYREPDTAARLVRALEEMDYPADKKDVQLLL